MKELDDIIDLAKNLPQDRKLLIFVSSKNQGAMLQTQISDSVFIFAENENEKLTSEAKIEYATITKEERFNCRCLIATKVLDAGINIKDERLHDIVIATEDGEDEFMQIIGRKRVTNNSQINLYIMTKSKSYFNTKRFECRKKLKFLSDVRHCNYCKSRHTSHSCEFCPKDVMKQYFANSQLLKPFDGLYRIDGNSIKINEMAQKKLQIMLDFYNDMIDKFGIYGDSAYIRQQLSWLGLESQYDERNYYSSNSTISCNNELINLLDKNLDKPLETNDAQSIFRQEFQDIVIRLKYYSKRSENVIGLNKINQILQEHSIPYKVESINGAVSNTIWRICKR